MQKEVVVLENSPTRFKIKADWDTESATYLTKKLYQYVNNGKISFELNAYKGSFATEFVVTVLEGVFSAVLYDLIKEIFKILNKKKEKNKEIKPVYIFTEKEEFIITGDKESKIPEGLKKELFG